MGDDVENITDDDDDEDNDDDEGNTHIQIGELEDAFVCDDVEDVSDDDDGKLVILTYK